MSYASQTPNLGLPQWILSEPPQMTDFNTAFSNIDQFAGEKAQPGGWTFEQNEKEPSRTAELFFVVDPTGIEPVSEKRSARVSPGAVCLQHSRRARPANRPTLW